MCKYIGAPDTTGVMPGYGCCRCHQYNGLQRERCSHCKRKHCALKIPAEIRRCEDCGFGYKAEWMAGLHYLCPVCASVLLTDKEMDDAIAAQALPVYGPKE